jgi:hypothetical protein
MMNNESRPYVIAQAPFNLHDAQGLRSVGEVIHGCWWCLQYKPKGIKESDFRPYWPQSMLVFIGHRLACPNHKKQYDEGAVS